MGEHWVNPRLVFEGIFDVARPAILTYTGVQGRPVLLGVGSKTKADLTAANKMFELLAPKKAKREKEKREKKEDEEEEPVYLERYDTPLEGTNLLGKNFGVEKHMFNFLNKHVKDYKSEWRDRRNKADL